MTARCRRPECGRPLRTDESVARGYGPVCWQRMHPWVYVPRPVAGDDPDQIPLPLEKHVTRYSVSFAQTISVTIEVDAEDPDEAIEKAANEGVPGVCAQCSGWGQDWSRDDDGELVPVAVWDKATDKEVWPAEGEK